MATFTPDSSKREERLYKHTDRTVKLGKGSIQGYEDKESVLKAVGSGKLKWETAKEILDEMDRTKGTVTVGVSNKGAVSVYGIRRMPVTYYASEWSRILAAETVDAIEKCIKDNSDILSRRNGED